MGFESRIWALVSRAVVSLLCIAAGALVPVAAARAETPPPLTVTNSPLSFTSPYRIDAQAPFAHGWYINALSCPTTSLCVGMDNQGNLLTTTDPTAPPSGWDRFAVGQPNESEVACPSASLCVAVGYDAGAPDIVTSTDPAGGPGMWHSFDLPRAWDPEFLTCPTTSFCAALTGDGTILTTDDPAGGAGSWVATTYTTGTGGGQSLACASASLCLIGTSQGTLFTSTDPTGGPGAWSAGQVQAPIGRFSCPTVHLCAGIGDYGAGFEVSTDPAAGASTWMETDLYTDNGQNGSPQVTCTASSLCMVLEPGGSVATTRDPEGGAAAWSTTQQVSVPPGDGYTWTAAPACPEDQWCVAPTGVGDIAVSTDPAGPTGSWPSHSVDGYNVLAGVSCTSAGNCVAVDDAGNVLTSTQPQLAQPWAAANIDTQPLTGVSCIADGPCVAVDRAGDVLASRDPSGGAAAWSTSDVDGENEIIAVSCANGPVCMAVDEAGNVLLSTDPTGGAAAWQVASVLTPGEDSGFTGVSCADATLCIAASLNSLEIVENPGRAGSVWKTVSPLAAQPGGQSPDSYSSVSCPSSSDCVATDGFADVTTDDPTGDASGWSSRQISYYNPAGPVTCEVSGLCLSLGPDDVIYETSTPTADYTQWGMGTPDSGGGGWDLGGAACPSSDFCLVVGNRGQAWAGEGSGYVPPPPPTTSGSGGGASGGGATGSSGGGTSAPSPAAAPTSPAQAFAPAAVAAPGPSGSGPTAAPAARRPATVRLRLRAIVLARHLARAEVTCAAASGRCTGTISLSTRARRPRVLATAHYDVAAGRSRTILLTISRRNVRLLRSRHARRLVVQVVLRPARGGTVRSRLVLR